MMSSLYSAIEKSKEETVKSILIDLAHDLKTHYHVEKAELTYQKLETKMLIALTERYQKYDKVHVITDANSRQEIYLKKFEMENDMYAHMINIRGSNKKINDSLDFLQPICDQLRNISDQINWHAKEEEVNDYSDDQDFKTLRNYVDIVFDLKREFRKRIVDRHAMQDMLNIQYGEIIEVYQELLIQQDEFNDVYAKMVFFSELMERES